MAQALHTFNAVQTVNAIYFYIHKAKTVRHQVCLTELLLISSRFVFGTKEHHLAFHLRVSVSQEMTIYHNKTSFDC